MNSKDERISSIELATLVIDALLRAKMIDEKDVTQAIEVATEEIEVRKAMGDY